MSVPRTRGISTKKTEEEYQRLKARAGADTLSEWLRQLALTPVSASAEGLVVLEEVLATRTLVLNLLYRISHHQPITDEDMRHLVERADAEKHRKALDRLLSSANGGGR